MLWQQSVINRDSDEYKVFLALCSPRFRWRTFEGIAESTSLPKDNVIEICARYSEFIRLSETNQPNTNRSLVGLIQRVGPSLTAVLEDERVRRERIAQQNAQTLFPDVDDETVDEADAINQDPIEQPPTTTTPPTPTPLDNDDF
jgi:hypothetical protein